MKKIEDIFKTDLTALTRAYQDACSNKNFKK